MKKNKEKTSQSWLNESEGKLAIDVFQTPKYFVIQAPVAGLEDKDLDITIDGNFLNIRGNRLRPEIDQKAEYIYQECYWGNFSRQVSLPENINADHIKAHLEKGILTIKIPKTSKKSKRKIEIDH